MKRHICLIFLFSVAFSCKKAEKRSVAIPNCFTPATSDWEWYNADKKAPILPGLDGVDFKITSTNPEAQRYFNQGMMLAYGFNHAEAARSFYQASKLDSNCAMAYWGYAYVLGPNYNAGMEPDHYERAYEAISKARALSTKTTPLEIALIDAMLTRYLPTPPADRIALDKAYSEAMYQIYKRFSTHPDVGTLYAESLLNLHPWDLYTKETKVPKKWTPEIVTLLERLIQTHSRHPGAHHLYIHALEASNVPEKALPSAHLLDSLVSGSGHLLHMPSHIYINTGDYHLGSLSNQRAIQSDSSYTTACHAQGVYPLAYFPHNYHFLAATATLEGNSKLAWMAAKKMQENTSPAIMDQPGWGTLQHYYIIPFYVAVKLGMWNDILALPAPVKNLAYPKAIWHYARGMAYLAKNNLPMAQKESDAIDGLAKDSSLHNVTIWDINTAEDLVKIASKVLSAGIAAEKGRLSHAITLLKEAVEIEDQLNYNEPPDWFFSVRHDLGAILLRDKKYQEAESQYRKDLKKWKKNGWALIGLYHSLALQKKKQEAQATLSLFNEAWCHADLKINSSSFSFSDRMADLP